MIEILFSALIGLAIIAFVTRNWIAPQRRGGWYSASVYRRLLAFQV